ncbi:MAG: sugar porter family MFS transporter [Balneolales bacterium]|nr:sugar porter family MFS transporter [Balneolales bacterium]
MANKKIFPTKIALIVALGGFLMGFDASVISGVVRFIEPEFGLSKLQLGWAVGSLTLTATLAMLFSGGLSDRFGRRAVLKVAAVLYAVSAVGSAFAPNFTLFVIARMVGGLGVGASLIIAPMYIAEIAPAKIRGRLVSFNQLNIVVGISAAFFSNYLILQWAQSDASLVSTLMIDQFAWRWMLGVETIPAVIYFLGLYFVPSSPRWQIMKGKVDEARITLTQLVGKEDAERQLEDVQKSLKADEHREKVSIKEIFHPGLRFVLIIGVTLAVLQQITGINAVFFYAPMIFEQSGIGTDASFMQAVLVGLINLVFTVIAILLIDKLGRRPLLLTGVAGITIAMMVLAYGFHSATYELDQTRIDALEIPLDESMIGSLYGITYQSDVQFKQAIIAELGPQKAVEFEAVLIQAAIDINPRIILFGILGFVASFAISLGPVMWVMFSELFPLRVRGLAISFAGFINSAFSFLVQLIFPWELALIGSSFTFLIYGLFAAAGLIFIWKMVPETKNKTLEELEIQLVK